MIFIAMVVGMIPAAVTFARSPATYVTAAMLRKT